MEPLTSLMIRELRILARDASRMARGFDVMAQVLRDNLQGDLGSAKLAINTRESGAEESRASGEALRLPFPEFGSGSQEDHD